MTAKVLPKLTDEQRAEALAKAKAARVFRAELKENIAAGRIDIAELIKGNLAGFTDQEAALVLGTKVEAILKAVRGVGAVRATELMDQIGIAENRRLRGLGIRQREALVEQLGLD